MIRALAVGLVIALVAAVGCGGERRTGRVEYNKGVAALEAGKLDDAERAFLAARDEAGQDPELRFRAAFDLALTYARKGDAAAAAGEQRDVDAAVARYRDAIGWFTDARRQRPSDADAQANLERVRARMLALIDEANRGAQGLEKRLEALIAGQRGLRDGARGLWMAQEARGAGGDPLADKDAFDATATRQRVLSAEAGVVADLAGDEITAIGGKAEAERSDEEKVRVVQLKNVDLYVQDARKAMTDARRNLHELKGELGHVRADAALEALKRAREQLLDPVAVMQAVAQEQLQLAGHTDELAARQAAHGRIGGDAPPPIPGWMTAPRLANQQIGLRSRLGEVESRLNAALAAKAARDQQADGGQGGQPAPPPDPKQEKVLAQVAAAMPAVLDASTAMKQAYDRLSAGDVAGGSAAQRAALVALSRAIEQFLDLRKLIDVALAEQQRVVAVLTPPAGGQPVAMSTEERARIVGEGAAKNRDRLVRMQGEIADALQEIEAQAAQAQEQEQAGSGTGMGTGTGTGAADPAAEAKQLYARAETLRAEAQAAIAQLQAVAAGGKGPPALESATTAATKLAEMQQLFFSVIEHLKELVREQGETRDQTATAQTEDDLSRQPLLPPILGREREHAAKADAIAQALAQQADAAAQQQAQGGAAQGGAPQGPGSDALREAAGEVRNGLTSMQNAAETLVKATDTSQQMSVNLQPALDDQQKAIEHLENALRLLQPPSKQPQQDQQQPDQQQDQQKQDQQQQQQQQQQQDRGQQVREREKQRERERRERQQQRAPEPVDKDW